MAGIEVPLNIEFDRFLNALEPHELYSLLTKWVGLPEELFKGKREKPSVRAFLPIPNGTIDELISFGDEIGIAIELKDKWKTSPGQLEQYFGYANSHFKKSFLLFVTQSSDDIRHRWISPLFTNPRWHHRTWASLWNLLISDAALSSKKAVVQFSLYIQSLQLNIDVRRTIRDYGLNVQLPDTHSIELLRLLQTTLSSDSPLGCWKSGTEFWEDVANSIRTQLGTLSFFSYRFDFYHYMFRWAFHERGVFFDMRKDNKWEYYYDYFKAHLEDTWSTAIRVTMSTWYSKYLKIPQNHYIKLPTCVLGVVKVNSEDCYFMIDNSPSNGTLQRLNFWEVINW